MTTHYPYAFCTTHGLFEVRGFGMQQSGPGHISLIGCTTRCPACGKLSEVVPGQYSDIEGRLNLLLDPSISPEALRAIRSIAERLSRNEITPEEAEAEAEKVAPPLKKLFSKLNTEAAAMIVAAIMQCAVAIYAAKMSNSGTTTINNYYAAPQPAAITETASSNPKPGFLLLPEIGPKPAVKPLNRHERRRKQKFENRKK